MYGYSWSRAIACGPWRYGLVPYSAPIRAVDLIAEHVRREQRRRKQDRPRADRRSSSTPPDRRRARPCSPPARTRRTSRPGRAARRPTPRSSPVLPNGPASQPGIGRTDSGSKLSVPAAPIEISSPQASRPDSARMPARELLVASRARARSVPPPSGRRRSPGLRREGCCTLIVASMPATRCVRDMGKVEITLGERLTRPRITFALERARRGRCGGGSGLATSPPLRCGSTFYWSQRSDPRTRSAPRPR